MTVDKKTNTPHPPKTAPRPEKLADTGAKTLQQARRDVARAAAEKGRKTKVER